MNFFIEFNNKGKKGSREHFINNNGYSNLIWLLKTSLNNVLSYFFHSEVSYSKTAWQYLFCYISLYFPQYVYLLSYFPARSTNY